MFKSILKIIALVMYFIGLIIAVKCQLKNDYVKATYYLGWAILMASLIYN